MATNGNERPMTAQDQANQKLSQMLRKIDDDPLAKMPEGARAPVAYDFMVRMAEAAQAAREIAAYSTDFAEHIEKATSSYVASMHKLLGKVGPDRGRGQA